MRHAPELVKAVTSKLVAEFGKSDFAVSNLACNLGDGPAKRILDTIAAHQNRKDLTPRQMQAHAFIIGYILQYSMSPTTREIAEALDTTPGNIHRLIDALVRKGWIKRVGKGARCLKQRLI